MKIWEFREMKNAWGNLLILSPEEFYNPHQLRNGEVRRIPIIDSWAKFCSPYITPGRIYSRCVYRDRNHEERAELS